MGGSFPWPPLVLLTHQRDISEKKNKLQTAKEQIVSLPFPLKKKPKKHLLPKITANFNRYFWTAATSLWEQRLGFYPGDSARLFAGSALFKHKQSSIVALETILSATSLLLQSSKSKPYHFSHPIKPHYWHRLCVNRFSTVQTCLCIYTQPFARFPRENGIVISP